MVGCAVERAATGAGQSSYVSNGSVLFVWGGELDCCSGNAEEREIKSN